MKQKTTSSTPVAHVGRAVGLAPRRAPRRRGRAPPRRRGRRGSTARSRRRAACRGSAGCRRCSRSRRPARRTSASSLSLRTPGWYSSRCPTISTRPARCAAATARSASADRLGQRLLHEAVLAGLQHPHGQVGVRGHRRGQHDRVQVGVGEQLVEVRRGPGRGQRRGPAGRAPPRRRRTARSPRAPGMAAKLRARLGPQ